jgi:hypothetical protein
MKNIVAIGSILICLLIVGGAGAVAIRPHDCLLLVEKTRRMWQDFRTAQYVDDLIKDKEKQRELQPVHN